MNPQKQFCHNQNCWAYGRKGEGHIVIHSHKEKRYRCKRCGRTFSQTKGTALYRLHKPQELVFVVLTLLAYGWLSDSGHSRRLRLRRADGLALAKRSRFSVPEGARGPGGSRECRAFAGSEAAMSCACGLWAGLCGWLRLWRSGAACGSAAS
jgi:hypothetical protein